jgi:hypothetical protein
MKTKVILAAITVLLAVSCETDSYNKGEGRYSLLQGDIAELTIDSQKKAVSFLTDHGDNYTLLNPFSASWIETADTVYRTIIYYNKVEEGKANAQSAAQLVTVHPVPHWRFSEMPQDPLGLESAWLSKSGKYLNLALLMKSGYVDDKEERQIIGLACDTVLTYTNQQRTAYYRLLHSQNDVPQYYTNRRYITIALPASRLDTIRLKVPTYDGLLERIIVMP